MGRQAGAFIELAQEKDLLWLERFAELVASAEREKIAEYIDRNLMSCREYADVIRARTQT